MEKLLSLKWEAIRLKASRNEGKFLTAKKGPFNYDRFLLFGDSITADTVIERNDIKICAFKL